MLALRLIAPNDYTVLEDGQPIGRIRFARERSPPIWVWRVTVSIPGPPFGYAKTIDDAKARFKAAWLMFKLKVGPEARWRRLMKRWSTRTGRIGIGDDVSSRLAQKPKFLAGYRETPLWLPRGKVHPLQSREFGG